MHDVMDHTGGTTRRSLLKSLGFLGLASVATSIATRARSAPPPGAGPAGPVQPVGSDALVTTLHDAGPAGARLSTGPLALPTADADARLGACLVVAGSPQAVSGPLPLITGLSALRVTGGAEASFEPDAGVDQAAYRLLGSLRVPRPAEVFGFSAPFAPANAASEKVTLEWMADVRAGTSPEVLREYLGQHAWFLGLLTPDHRFEQLHFVSVRRVG